MFAGVDGVQGARTLITHDALVFTPLELDLVKTAEEDEVQTSTHRRAGPRLGQILRPYTWLNDKSEACPPTLLRSVSNLLGQPFSKEGRHGRHASSL